MNVRFSRPHTVTDDCSWLAYAEICDDENAVNSVGVLLVRRSGRHGAPDDSDNGSAYGSKQWVQTCGGAVMSPKWTRPYRPQTHGRVERFHRPLTDGWAYARRYRSEQVQRKVLGRWLHSKRHRPYSE